MKHYFKVEDGLAPAFSGGIVIPTKKVDSSATSQVRKAGLPPLIQLHTANAETQLLDRPRQFLNIIRP